MMTRSNWTLNSASQQRSSCKSWDSKIQSRIPCQDWVRSRFGDSNRKNFLKRILRPPPRLRQTQSVMHMPLWTETWDTTGKKQASIASTYPWCKWWWLTYKLTVFTAFEKKTSSQSWRLLPLPTLTREKTSKATTSWLQKLNSRLKSQSWWVNEAQRSTLEHSRKKVLLKKCKLTKKFLRNFQIFRWLTSSPTRQHPVQSCQLISMTRLQKTILRRRW